MKCHEDSSTKLQRATSQSHNSKESNDTTRSARWRRECRLVTQPADHEKNVKAGDATSGPREEHVGQHVARRNARAREEELEQATSRDVRRDEQSQREPAVRQRQALDGGQ